MRTLNIVTLGCGAALIWLVIFAADCKNPSTRMVFRSAWGGAVYGIGVVLFVAGVLA